MALKRTPKHLLRFLKNEQAVALIEFAIVFPVMVLLLFGGIEITRYILITQKIEKATYAMTNMVSQMIPATEAGGTGQISNAALQGVFNQFYGLMQPYSMGSPGNVTNGIVSFDSVIHISSGNRNLIRWERTGGGSCASCGTRPPSIVTHPAISGMIDHAFSPSPGTVYNCPNAPFTPHYSTQLEGMLNHENFIVGQVYFKYEPLLNHIGVATGMTFSLPSRVITRAFFIHPRNGDLLDADPAFVAPTEAQGRCNNA